MPLKKNWDGLTNPAIKTINAKIPHNPTANQFGRSSSFLISKQIIRRAIAHFTNDCNPFRAYMFCRTIAQCSHVDLLRGYISTFPKFRRNVLFQYLFSVSLCAGNRFVNPQSYILFHNYIFLVILSRIACLYQHVRN